MMAPGDTIRVHMFDAPVPGHRGKSAFEVTITDLTTGQRGWMQASAANGFAHTTIHTCATTPFNFQPEYTTAKPLNIIPWAADQTDISTEFETGHWEPCTSLTTQLALTFGTGASDFTYNMCHGVYENAGPPDTTTPELGDAFCYPSGDTHPGYDGLDTSTTPDRTTGCQDNYFQNGDLDFDGSPYWTEWPTGTSPTRYPSTFVEQLPVTGAGSFSHRHGTQYASFLFQTDIGLSEVGCKGDNYTEGTGTTTRCSVPPNGPGHFYPYWSLVKGGTRAGPTATASSSCVLEFGNVDSGSHLDTYGGDAQYGTNRYTTTGYPQIISTPHHNPCS
jgi:hypothetical protein